MISFFFYICVTFENSQAYDITVSIINWFLLRTKFNVEIW